MEVLELPRPVINFMRSISKEMHRYTLSWDMFGASDSVSLTLTWKLNCDSNDGEDTVKRSRKQHQQKINDLIQSTQTESSDTSLEKNPKYFFKKSSINKSSMRHNNHHKTALSNTSASTRKQMQHFKLDTIADELQNKKTEAEVGSNVHKHRSHGKQKLVDSLLMRRNLSAESLQPKVKGKDRHIKEYQSPDKSNRHQQHSNQQRSSSLSRGKSLENYEKLNDTSCPCCEKYKNLEDLNEVLKFNSLRLKRVGGSSSNSLRRPINKNHDSSCNNDTSQYFYQPRVQFETSHKTKNKRNNPTSYENDFVNNSGSQSDDSTSTISVSDTISNQNNISNDPTNNPWIKRNNLNGTNPGGYNHNYNNNYKEKSSSNYIPKSSYYDFNNTCHNLNDSDLFRNEFLDETALPATSAQASSTSGLKVRFFKG